MNRQRNNYAFIDSQNVNVSIRDSGWRLDWRRFRIYLQEKYGVTKAFLFLGYISSNQALYSSLRNSGFLLIFKPVLPNIDGHVKGNCDAELVLHAMIEKDHFEKAVIATGDGDFSCLIQYFLQIEKLERLLVPNRDRYSGLLKRAGGKNIDFMNDLRGKLELKKEKNPRRTEP